MEARGGSATLATMRSRCRIERGLVPAVLVLFSCGPVAGAGPDPFDTYRVLGDDGAIFEWSPGGNRLRRAAAPLESAEPGGTIKDLASFAGGTRLIVLTPNRNEAGQGRKRREGLAILYDTGRPNPAVIHRIRLEGDGYAVAAAPDGHLCYILAARLDGGRGGPRFWIHALDPEAGEVVGSTLLDRPATGLTVAPNGLRLFVSFENRIQSYTTSPLLASWHYRSPGINGGLYFPPAGNVLYAIRTGGVALFDPVVILNRDRSVPRDDTDDSTDSIRLPFGPSALLFSPERPRAAAVGAGTVAFIDLTTGEVSPSQGDPALTQGADLLRPIGFLPGGELVLGLFPAAVTTAIPAPEALAPDHPPLSPATTAESAAATAATLDAAQEESRVEEPAPPPVPDAPVAGAPADADVGAGAAGVAPDDGLPAPLEPPAGGALPVPIVAAPPPPDLPGAVSVPREDPEPRAAPATGYSLAGRLSGEHGRVVELVLYGPGSIIREYARVAPAADGRFRIPLPPPGTYRLVPVGEASRPVASNPNFHTIIVEAGTDRSDLDFSIDRGP